MARAPIAFDEFEIDPARGELRRAGAPVPVEPQVLDLIAYLAARAGEIVSRDELIEAVWGGRIVSDSAISSRINAARTALDDDGTAQRVIRTVPRRGFLFVPEVAQEKDRETDAGAVQPERRSIAVLPFQNISGDPEQTYFSDGITDDIITDLSRYPELFVIARHSSFAYRGSGTRPIDIARELSVQYIAEGSVRRAGNRIRVTARLIDPWAGNELWAERYDRELTDIFEVQDEITSLIVNTLAGQITRQHYLRSRDSSTETVDAYEHVLRATQLALRVAPADNARARVEAQKAIAIDPKLARARAILALTYLNEANNVWVADPEASNARAYEAVARAVGDDDRDPWAFAMLGIAELWHNRAHDRAVAAMRRSIELNPSNVHFRSLCSYVLAFAGQARDALDEIDRALRMNPHPLPVYLGFRGRALLLLRRFDEATPCLETMVTMMPGHSNALGYAAVAYAASGRVGDAKATVKELVSSNPHYRLAVLRRILPFSDPSDLALITDNLARAGLPD